jgi:hypothetical protein
MKLFETSGVLNYNPGPGGRTALDEGVLNMVRNVVGFAVFAAVVLMALKLLGFVWSFFGTILWLAFLGFVFYLILRVFSPRTADRVRDTIKGEPPNA